MAALRIGMTIPLGDAGQIHFAADIPAIDALTAEQRQAIAETGREFYAFAASTLDPATPPAEPTTAEVKDELAAIYDPSASVLAGVTGTRRNTS